MRIKAGVTMAGLSPLMRKVLVEADRIWMAAGLAEGVTVTGALDGVHSAGSVHYYGYALDLRTRDFDPLAVDAVARELQAALGTDYQVVVEADHVHVEWWKARHLNATKLGLG